jgi:hypothetical protein
MSRRDEHEHESAAQKACEVDESGTLHGFSSKK